MESNVAFVQDVTYIVSQGRSVTASQVHSSFKRRFLKPVPSCSLVANVIMNAPEMLSLTALEILYTLHPEQRRRWISDKESWDLSTKEKIDAAEMKKEEGLYCYKVGIYLSDLKRGLRSNGFVSSSGDEDSKF
ncbi:hypothetical protein Tco_0799221 [Tanacetum coccineum]